MAGRQAFSVFCNRSARVEAELGRGKTTCQGGEYTFALLLHCPRVLVSVVLMHWTLKLTAGKVMSGKVFS